MIIAESSPLFLKCCQYYVIAASRFFVIASEFCAEQDERGNLSITLGSDIMYSRRLLLAMRLLRHFVPRNDASGLQKCGEELMIIGSV